MAVLPELLVNNERFAQAFDKGHLSAPPARRVAIVACMDARLHPEAFLGLEIGDAHCIRNAGGRASDDAIRSLIVSTHLLGTQEIVVIGHTDCGMAGVSNQELAERVGDGAAEIDFLPISDPAESVRHDVSRIRGHALIPDGLAVSGYLYDVRSGRLDEVEPAR